MDSSTNPSPRSLSERISHREAIVLVAVIVLGLTLRLWSLGSMGIDHFDGAVYAFSALGLTQPGQPHVLYPGQVSFSPPLFIELVGLSYLLFGAPSASAALLVNVLFGTLTIAVMWWVGRTWFDAATGMAAAVLVALNQVHIAFSRTVLTDVVFTMLFLVALAAIATAVRRRSLKLAVVAGIAVGLAWNTKYHGWFAGAVGVGAVLAYVVTNRSARSEWVRLAAIVGIISAVATLSYLPWALFVQMQPGGYPALARVHRMMLDMNYLHNAWQQIQMQLYFDGPFSRAAVPLALLATILTRGGSGGLSSGFLLALGSISLAAVIAGGNAAVALLGIAALPVLWRQRQRFEVWVLVGWALSFAVSMPLYRPYARLALPLVVALSLLAGASLAELARDVAVQRSGAVGRSLLTAVVAVLVVLAPQALAGNRTPWSDSQGYARAAAIFEETIPKGEPVVVLGDPALAFYLHLSGRPAFERTQEPAELAHSDTPLYVIAGMYTHRSPQLRKGLEALRGGLAPLATVRVTPSDVRLLDDFALPEAEQQKMDPDATYDLTLYRLMPQLAEHRQ